MNIARARRSVSYGTHHALHKCTLTNAEVYAATGDGVNEHDPGQGPKLIRLRFGLSLLTP